jgi:hypothetical protein
VRGEAGSKGTDGGGSLLGIGEQPGAAALGRARLVAAHGRREARKVGGRGRPWRSACWGVLQRFLVMAHKGDSLVVLCDGRWQGRAWRWRLGCDAEGFASKGAGSPGRAIYRGDVHPGARVEHAKMAACDAVRLGQGCRPWRLLRPISAGS